MMVRSVEKAFHILSFFSMDETELSLSELQNFTKYPKSTIFRLLDTMQSLGYIDQNPDSHKYSLGFKFFYLGSIVQNTFDYRKISLPIMKTLAEETEETIELNIVKGNERVCIEKVDSVQAIRNFVEIGERTPLHLGASGKVLLANLSEEKRNESIASLKLTKKQLNDLLNELELIRKKRFCFTHEERVQGSFSISSPIINHTRQVVAGLTVAGPIQRLTEQHKLHLIAKLIDATKMISMRLGYDELSTK